MKLVSRGITTSCALGDGNRPSTIGEVFQFNGASWIVRRLGGAPDVPGEPRKHKYGAMPISFHGLPSVKTPRPSMAAETRFISPTGSYNLPNFQFGPLLWWGAIAD